MRRAGDSVIIEAGTAVDGTSSSAALQPDPMALPRFAGKRRALLAAWGAVFFHFAAAAPVDLEIPAQPVASALVRFAQQARVEVLFSYRDLAAVQSPALAGRFEPEDALARLLTPTGFVARRTAAGKFVIVRAERQPVQLRGAVVDDVDEAPVPEALVQVDDAPFAIRVSARGRFATPEVTAGEHVLTVRAEGYRTVRVLHVQAMAGQATDVGLVRLARGSDDPERLAEIVVDADQLGAIGEIVSLEAVTVTPSRYLLTQDRGSVAATLTHTDLQALPQLGDDLYRAIAHLPGLAADDLTAKFWVRGAPYDKVLARLDGVELLEPFHLKDVDSTISILDLETIGTMDLSTGGFTAEYGNRLAGVLTMETDRHVRAAPQTTLAVSLTGVRAATRGASADGRNHWLVSGRTGYPALALDLTDAGNLIKPRYHDVYGKWEYDLLPRHTVSLHALHAADSMEYRDASGPVVNNRYGSDYAWLRWRGSFGERTEEETVLSATWVDWHRRGSGAHEHVYPLALEDDRTARALVLRQDWTEKLSGRAMLRAGFAVAAESARYRYHSVHDEPTVRDGTVVSQTFERRAAAAPRGATGGAYGTFRVQPARAFVLEFGVRGDANDYGGGGAITPRFNAVYAPGRFILRAAWGEYAQFQGVHELAIADGETSFQRAERAEQRIVSIERRLSFGINVRAEAYQRIVHAPRPHWENVVDALDVVGELGYDRLRIDPVSQRAQGVELIVEQRSRPRFTWSASYALARSDETLREGAVIPTARDQRHTLYLDASYTPNARWQFSAAWQYHSGWPATPVVFAAFPLANGGAAVFGRPGPLYATRLPDYHRLDFRIQRRIPLTKGELRLYLDVFNAYARRNSIGYRYTVTVRGTEIDAVSRENDHRLFPLLPSVGAIWDF